MVWNKCKYLLLSVILLLAVTACSVSYKFNGASIDYSKTKTITIVDFVNRAPYQWAQTAPIFNSKLKDMYASQTRLMQVKRNGDLQVSGEITGFDRTNKGISSDGRSNMLQVRMTVNVRFTNTVNQTENFERQFSATYDMSSTTNFNSVQQAAVEQMSQQLCDQIFNATVANW